MSFTGQEFSEPSRIDAHKLADWIGYLEAQERMEGEHLMFDMFHGAIIRIARDNGLENELAKIRMDRKENHS